MPKPYPIPDDLTRPFWDAANRGQLVIQRCQSCRRFQHLPNVMCLSCGGADLAYEPVSGRGTVHSFTIVHEARHKAFREIQPYAVAAVELEEQPGLLLLSNLPGTPLAGIHSGLKVEVTFETVSASQRLPQFQPTGQYNSGHVTAGVER